MPTARSNRRFHLVALTLLSGLLLSLACSEATAPRLPDPREPTAPADSTPGES
jgi:hypothetical protein